VSKDFRSIAMPNFKRFSPGAYPRLRKGSKHANAFRKRTPKVGGFAAGLGKVKESANLGEQAYGEIKHPVNYIAAVLESAKSIPEPGDARAFVAQFVNASPLYTNSESGMAALMFEALLLEKFPDVYMNFVESQIEQGVPDFLAVFHGKIDANKLKSIVEDAKEFCTLEVVVEAGATSESAISNLTVISGVPVAGVKKKAEASKLLPTTPEEYKKVTEDGGVPNDLFGHVMGNPEVDYYSEASQTHPDGIRPAKDANGITWWGDGNLWKPDLDSVNEAVDAYVDEARFNLAALDNVKHPITASVLDGHAPSKIVARMKDLFDNASKAARLEKYSDDFEKFIKTMQTANSEGKLKDSDLSFVLSEVLGVLLSHLGGGLQQAAKQKLERAGVVVPAWLQKAGTENWDEAVQEDSLEEKSDLYYVEINRSGAVLKTLEVKRGVSDVMGLDASDIADMFGGKAEDWEWEKHHSRFINKDGKTAVLVESEVDEGDGTPKLPKIPNYKGKRNVTMGDYGTVYKSAGRSWGGKGSMTGDYTVAELRTYLKNHKDRLDKDPNATAVIIVQFNDGAKERVTVALRGSVDSMFESEVDEAAQAVPSLDDDAWHTFGGGTSAPEDTNSYQLNVPEGEYHVQPIAGAKGKLAYYTIKFANTQKGGKTAKNFSGGLWRDVGKAYKKSDIVKMVRTDYTQVVNEAAVDEARGDDPDKGTMMGMYHSWSKIVDEPKSKVPPADKKGLKAWLEDYKTAVEANNVKTARSIMTQIQMRLRVLKGTQKDVEESGVNEEYDPKKPRKIKSGMPSTCAKCGKSIPIGAKIIVNPNAASGKKCQHLKCARPNESVDEAVRAPRSGDKLVVVNPVEANPHIKTPALAVGTAVSFVRAETMHYESGTVTQWVVRTAKGDVAHVRPRDVKREDDGTDESEKMSANSVAWLRKARARSVLPPIGDGTNWAEWIKGAAKAAASYRLAGNISAAKSIDDYIESMYNKAKHEEDADEDALVAAEEEGRESARGTDESTDKPTCPECGEHEKISYSADKGRTWSDTQPDTDSVCKVWCRKCGHKGWESDFHESTDEDFTRVRRKIVAAVKHVIAPNRNQHKQDAALRLQRHNHRKAMQKVFGEDVVVENLSALRRRYAGVAGHKKGFMGSGKHGRTGLKESAMSALDALMESGVPLTYTLDKQQGKLLVSLTSPTTQELYERFMEVHKIFDGEWQDGKFVQLIDEDRKVPVSYVLSVTGVDEAEGTPADRQAARAWWRSLSLNQWKALEKKHGYTWTGATDRVSGQYDLWLKEGKPEPETTTESDAVLSGDIPNVVPHRFPTVTAKKTKKKSISSPTKRWKMEEAEDGMLRVTTPHAVFEVKSTIGEAEKLLADVVAQYPKTLDADMVLAQLLEDYCTDHGKKIADAKPNELTPALEEAIANDEAVVA
jgi:hypothetical protein